MPAKAFVLIETVVGRNKEVAAALKQLGSIKSVRVAYSTRQVTVLEMPVIG